MGFKTEDWERALEAVPPIKADPESWPEGVRPISMDDLEHIGIDRKNVLYWQGRVITIRKGLVLTAWQKVWAIIVSMAAFLVGISVFAQGLVAYFAWACSVGWWSVCAAP